MSKQAKIKNRSPKISQKKNISSKTQPTPLRSGVENKKQIVVINGPNLNQLGKREVGLYGRDDLTSVVHRLSEIAADAKVEINHFQSNHEGEIVDFIQQLSKVKGKTVGLIVNPAALGHTSIAIRDALLFLELPLIEVHVSNIYKREPFRHKTYLSDIAIGVIAGLGTKGYDYALLHLLSTRVNNK